jgi:3-isopropylmalate/(R)-2-methylmalate dehydratase small subunit
MAAVQKDRAAKVSADLETQTLTLPDGSTTTFEVDAFAKHCLLNGIDELGYLLGFETEISRHEQRLP